jgi:hypothetical protein
MTSVALFDTPHQLTFAQALQIEIAALQAQYPAHADALSMANALIHDGRIFVEDSGEEAMVLSTDAQGQMAAYHVNGTCTCPAGTHGKRCKHRTALHVYRRVVDRMYAPAPTKTVPKRSWFVCIHGTEAIRFEGVRALAEEAGLVALETTVVQATADLAICQCTATFRDGRVFTDIGDATPDNVATKALRPHFVRIAATRATARALRRALNISQVAVEELGQEALAAAQEAA